MVTDIKIVYKDIKIGEKDTYSEAKSAWPAFYFSVKHSWDWFCPWWSFQRRPSQFSATLPITTNPSLFPGFRPHPGATKIRPRGATRGSDGSTGIGVWVAVPRGWSKRGEEEEDGGRAFLRPAERGRIYQQIEWNIVRLGFGWVGVQEGKGMEKSREEEKASMSAGSASGHSPDSQHRKSFILESACCRLLLSTHSRVGAYSYSTYDPVSNPPTPPTPNASKWHLNVT